MRGAAQKPKIKTEPFQPGKKVTLSAAQVGKDTVQNIYSAMRQSFRQKKSRQKLILQAEQRRLLFGVEGIK